MRKHLFILLILLMAFSVRGFGQSGTSGRIRYGATLPATCSPSTGDLFFHTTTTIGLYQCLVANTWSVVGLITSVGLTTNADFLTVSNSPITSSGNIVLNKTTGLAANSVVATPDGTTGVVSVRALANNDIPTTLSGKTLNSPTINGGALAGTFTGTPIINCSNCTGITGASGGISNTGNTTIAADSGATGTGAIFLQTHGGITRLQVANDGTVTVNGTVIGITPYDIGVELDSQPTAGQEMLHFVANRSFTLAITGSTCHANTAATAQTDFVVQYCPAGVSCVNKGTLRFAAAGSFCSVVTPTSTSVSSGDVVKILAPGTADVSLSNVTFSLKGTVP